MTLDEKKIANLVEYWNQGATEDLESAETILFTAGKVGSALFSLHLALEKALKAAYVNKLYVEKGKELFKWILSNSLAH